MKSAVLCQAVLLLASLVMSVEVPGKSQFCSMQLPRALVAVCGLTKRAGNAFGRELGTGLGLGKNRRRFRMRPFKRMRVGSASYLYSGLSKRGLAPLHVMADVCCRRGCSLEDLLETCRA